MQDAVLASGQWWQEWGWQDWHGSLTQEAVSASWDVWSYYDSTTTDEFLETLKLPKGNKPTKIRERNLRKSFTNYRKSIENMEHH